MISTVKNRCLFSIARLLLSAAASWSLDAAAPFNDSEKTLHILNRLAYGPRPGDVDAVRRLGIKRYIDQQLNPDSLPLPEDLDSKLSALSTYQLSAPQLYQQYGPPSFPPNSATPDEKNAAHQRANKEITPQVHFACLWLATESPLQLHEVMTEFWFNDFEGKEWVR